MSERTIPTASTVPSSPNASPGEPRRLREVMGVFLRLGATAFGGPAAHIAMMREEIVQRRQWVSEAQFVDLLGIANLLPGPTSTQMTIYLGYLRAGWPGLVLGGACFILPAMLIVIALAWAYVTFGALPQVDWLFYGIQPVVVAIVAQAIWNLSRSVLKANWLIAAGLVIVALYLAGVNLVLLLFGGGLLIGALRWTLGKRAGRDRLNHLLLPLSLGAIPSTGAAAAAAVPYSLGLLFVTFLKIGAVIYGSGYVLLAFLRTDLVEKLGWLTDQQLLDAVAVGQFTPGPVFTTATFIGYVVGGLPGALAATVAIFLPAFLFVALVQPVAAKLRRSPVTAALLDGVNVAALGLMTGVLVQIARNALIDPITWLMALAALAVLVRFRINSAWLILLGALLGVLRFALPLLFFTPLSRVIP